MKRPLLLVILTAWMAAHSAPAGAYVMNTRPHFGDYLYRETKAFIGAARARPYLVRSPSIWANFAEATTDADDLAFDVRGGIILFSCRQPDSCDELGGVLLNDRHVLQAVGIRFLPCSAHHSLYRRNCANRPHLAVFVPRSPNAAMNLRRMRLWARDLKVAQSDVEIIWLAPRRERRLVLDLNYELP